MSTEQAIPGSRTMPVTRRERVAKAITEITAPAPVASAVLVAEGVRTGSGMSGFGYGLLAALFSCLLPLAAVLFMVRTQRLTDHHVKVRAQRALPLGIGIACTTTGIALLAGSGAPSELVRVTLAMLVGLIVALLINLRWKASIHTAVMAGSVVLLTTLAGPVWLFAGLLVPVTAWSRVVCRDHTPAETLAGATFGAVTSAVMLQLLVG